MGFTKITLLSPKETILLKVKVIDPKDRMTMRRQLHHKNEDEVEDIRVFVEEVNFDPQYN